MAIHLFMASTPFNMLTAAMVAFDLPAGDQAVLALIDQPIQQRPFVDALLAWEEAPFSEVRVVSYQAKGKNKGKIRQQGFEQIDQLLRHIQPDRIYTGNDRRIEFQYAMHKSGCQHGAYLDDGTYSYLGRQTHWLKDKIIDNWVKKLSYGLWWQQPSTIGGSAWIKEAVLAFPEAAVAELKSKHLTPLPQNLDRSEFQALARLCISGSGISEEQLYSITALVMLPHQSVTDSHIRHKLIYWLDSSDGKIAFKHHPRTQLRSQDGDRASWGLSAIAQQVPAGIPMEVLLPLLNSDCRLAGDVSTALLTAKWLRPELTVTAFCSDTTTSAWIDLLHRLGIQTEQ